MPLANCYIHARWTFLRVSEGETRGQLYLACCVMRCGVELNAIRTGIVLSLNIERIESIYVDAEEHPLMYREDLEDGDVRRCVPGANKKCL